MQHTYNEEVGNRLALTNFSSIAAEEVLIYKVANDEEDDASSRCHGAQQVHYSAQRHLKESETGNSPGCGRDRAAGGRTGSYHGLEMPQGGPRPQAPSLDLCGLQVLIHRKEGVQ